MSIDFGSYLRGERLYGDELEPDETREWIADEAEAYAQLGARNESRYEYAYHQLNRQHAYRFIQERTFDRALGLGSAYGDEFRPIASRIREIAIVESSTAFSNVSEILGTPIKYVSATEDGSLPFPNDTFDLLTSLGVMHHLPNVSYVMRECYRCLKTGGIMLLREPIVSMGDWREPREGLTLRERGIPLSILRRIVKDVGFGVTREALCVFPVVPRVAKRLGMQAFNSVFLTYLDAFLSRVFARNVRYHRTKLQHRFAPAAAYFVLKKQL